MSVAAETVEAPRAASLFDPSPRKPDPARRSAAPAVVALDHPTGYAAWDAYVAASPDGTWFHSTAWMRAVQLAFGHQPVYLQAQRDERLVGVLPLFLVQSLFGGRMLVSVPYGVYGGALADNADARSALREALMATIGRLNVANLDLRSFKPEFDGFEPNDRYVTFRRELPSSPADVLGWLPRKARAAARQGRDRHGLTIAHGSELLPEVWQLYSRSMRRLASLNYPYPFFNALVELAPERTLTSVVRHAGRPVAGLLTLLFRDTAMPYFVGTDERAPLSNVSHYLYSAVMERVVEMGYRVFDFGRSRCDNPGCCDFKRFQGFAPTALGYQRFVAPGARVRDLTPTGAGFGLGRRWWPRLPLWATRPLGAWLARHLPG
jgi:FemAB-related protein (PEP-CTERM system-associated)